MTQLGTATIQFADRLAECVERKRSQLVLGLDPVVDLLPVELQGEAVGFEGAAAAAARFCRGLIDAAAPAVIGIKPQLAFFELLG
jgi:orotidine-5'-phosphate decarboxylase